MATEENFLYWRLYLYLNEGVPFLSRHILSREVKKCDRTLRSILMDYEKQLKKNASLDKADQEMLFPVDGEINSHKWSANLYISVILTLFSKALSRKERKQLTDVHNVLKNVLENEEDSSLDKILYDDHMDRLEDAFVVLSFDEHSTMKVLDIKQKYVDDSLNYPSLLEGVEKMNCPCITKQKLIEFIELITLTNTCVDVYEDDPVILPDEKEHVMRQSTFDQPDKQTESNDAPSRDEDYTSDEIDDKKLNVESTSDEIGNNTRDIESTSDEIVSLAANPLTDDDRAVFEQEWKLADEEACIQDKDSFLTTMESKLKQLKQVPVNVAILGRSGVGKSRLNNAIRGIESKEDSLYAPVGSTETTMKATPYAHPNNPLLKLWDLPGIGTKTFPTQSYFKSEDIKFYSYDIYVIVCADRFMMDDEIFAEEIDRSGKPYLFVRNKADINEDEYGDGFESELHKMREDCKKSLSLRTIKTKDVYMISSKFVQHRLLDFGKLVERLVQNLPVLKREVLLNYSQSTSRTLIVAKKKQLRTRTLMSSIISAIKYGLPLSGLSKYIDNIIISDAIKDYRKILNVTEIDLEKLAKKMGMSETDLKREYHLNSFDILEKNASLYSSILDRISQSEEAKIKATSLPIVGIPPGAYVAYYTTYRFLEVVLDIIVADSKKMLDIHVKLIEERFLHPKYSRKEGKKSGLRE